MDVYGDHCLVCSCGGDRTKRHHLVRNEFYFLCNSAGLNPELERPACLRPRPIIGGCAEDGSQRDDTGARRPADVYLPRYRLGAAACLDFAVTSGLRTDILPATLQDNQAPARRYEDYKCSHLDTKSTCEAEGMTFIPMVMEACGGSWGPSAHKVLNELAKSSATASGESESIAVERILQNTGFIVHRESARAIVRRRVAAVSTTALPLLSAAAALGDTY